MTISRYLAIGIANAVLASCLWAVPVPGLSLTQLDRTSDLIVVGKVSSLSRVGVGVIEQNSQKFPCELMTFDLLVDQTIKGLVLSQKITVGFSVPAEFLGYRFPKEGDYGVYFLQKLAKHYTLTSPFHPSVIAIPGVQVSGISSIEDIISQMTAALQSPSTTRSEKLQIIRAFLSNHEDAATKALHEGATNDDQVVKFRAIGILLARDDISYLELAAQVLLGPDSRIASNDEQLREAIESMANGIGAGVKDPRAIPLLTKLRSSDDATVRRYATRALMRTESIDAVPALVSSLDDTDAEVRFLSAEGLAKITMQPDRRPVPNDAHNGNDDWLGYWKEWAKTKR